MVESGINGCSGALWSAAKIVFFVIAFFVIVALFT